MFTLTYEILKLQPGTWYFEIYAERNGIRAKIRPGNTPYKTKREAIAQAQQKIADLKAERKDVC